MTPEKHARIKEIFLETCSRPPDGRRAYISKACRGDRMLRREVERLINHHLPSSQTTQDAAAREPALLELALDIAEIPAFKAGEMISERYRIVSALGEGGMGRVYRADDTRLDVPVALKFLSKLHGIDATWRKRVEREVNLSREVGHSNICRVYDLGDANGAPYISMEYIDGENLASLLRKVGRLTDQRAIDIARQICAGLAAAHIHGVLHRDLKPANVMIDQKGRAVITDFGLAVPTGHIDRRELRSGTPRYMAPEQLAGVGVSEKSDIYSLGLVLYEMFTGKPAFDEVGLAEYLRSHQSVEPTPPSTIVPDIDPVIEAVIVACLQKDPDKRPESALYVAASLPGGDLLASALDAGQIPTRELLADAAARGEINKRRVLGTAIATLSLFAVAMLVGNNTHPIAANKVKSPEVFFDKAREVANLAGLTLAPKRVDGSYFSALDARISRNVATLSGTEVTLAIPPHEDILFRYREGFTNPRPPGTGFLSFIMPAASPFYDDSDLDPSTTIILDGRGRPLIFESMAPPDVDGPAADWQSIVRAAGHDPGDLIPTKPLTVPSVYVTKQLAFLDPSAKPPDGSERIEIALSENRVRYFAVLRESGAPQVSPLFSTPARLNAILTLRSSVLIVLLAVAIPAAWRNWRNRGDLIGAVRVGCCVAGLRLFSGLLSTRNLAGYSDTIEHIASGCLSALCEGMIVALFYLALESHVRKLWPRTLGGWSRMLNGRIRDPFVGRDVLLGCMVGCFWAILIFMDRRIPDWLGWQSRPQLQTYLGLDDLFGGRFLMAGMLNSLRGGVYQGLTVLLILVIATWLARSRKWPALLMTWFVVAAMYVPIASHPVTAWTLFAIGIVAVGIYVLTHWGLVSLLSALVVTSLLCVPPITFDFNAWYAGYGIFGCVASMFLALWGLYQSLQYRDVKAHMPQSS